MHAFLLRVFGALPRGLVHGDLFVDNALFSGDGLTLIDFEEAAHGPLVLDLGMALVGTAWSVTYKVEPPAELEVLREARGAA